MHEGRRAYLSVQVDGSNLLSAYRTKGVYPDIPSSATPSLPFTLQLSLWCDLRFCSSTKSFYNNPSSNDIWVYH